jgi:hypothetical protein
MISALFLPAAQLYTAVSSRPASLHDDHIRAIARMVESAPAQPAQRPSLQTGSRRPDPQQHQSVNQPAVNQLGGQLISQTEGKTYRHAIHFRGSHHPKGSYQLQISELDATGHLCGHARWNFPTFRALALFLKTNFPSSQALNNDATPAALKFEHALAMV